jgi:cytochrome c-type protein NapB
MTLRCLLGVWFCLLAVVGCGTKPSKEMQPASQAVREQRRAFQGAPPVIPHHRLGGACVTCHNAGGDQVIPNLGIAPANPHLKTTGLGAKSRCEQCHVFEQTDGLFAETEFTPFFVRLAKSKSSVPREPPAIPHALFMREDCKACHAGPAARPEIRCQHAERQRCRQCHISPASSVDNPSFISSAGPNF